MQALPNKALYDDLIALPASLTGEILNGQLYAHPRPGGKHIVVASNLGSEIHGPYHRGRGGPGGWWILQEPEVHFVLDEQVAVPDVAGWRRERMPEIPDSHKFDVVPDWICEILSPSTESVDREIKQPLYAQAGVQYLWLISPIQKTLEAFKRVDGGWTEQGVFSADQDVCVEPFESVTITVNDLLG